MSDDVRQRIRDAIVAWDRESPKGTAPDEFVFLLSERERDSLAQRIADALPEMLSLYADLFAIQKAFAWMLWQSPDHEWAVHEKTMLEMPADVELVWSHNMSAGARIFGVQPRSPMLGDDGRPQPSQDPGRPRADGSAGA